MDFIDLKAQQEKIRQKIKNNIDQVLAHGRYIMGPEIKELEQRLSQYTGAKHAIGVASGTDALLMSLMAYGVGRGDAVFTTPFTFIATAEVIQLLGATPVFVDINPETYNIDPEKLQAAIIKVGADQKLKPRGILPVDLFGQPADYDQINELGRKYNLFVIEDAAQSFGASYKGKKAGSLSEVAATSFFPAKPLGCYGDGGMIFTNSDEMLEKLTSIRVHGMGFHKYENIRVGINGRLDTLQAAILLAKMEIFDQEVNQRQEVANYYNQQLRDTVRAPYVEDFNISAWAQYALRHPQRDKIIERLKENKIPSAIYYPLPLHMQKAFAGLGYREGDFPISEKSAAEIFSIPFHPYLSREDQDIIIKAIKEAV
jgi:UDP-2-acetamido-2-deoxy-ribo-hexuluronate aminotransferase